MANYKFNWDTTTDIQKITQTVAVSLDELKAWIDQILDNLSIDSCPIEHLNIIANLLGYPANKEDDPDFIRRSLRNAINLYKSKGTEESIKVIFYNLGFNVDIVPLWTADFVEKVQIFPPYIATKVPVISKTGIPYNAGYVDITIMNPDDQFFTSIRNTETPIGGYQFVNS
jgi:phage tail P2-like protein